MKHMQRHSALLSSLPRSRSGGRAWAFSWAGFRANAWSGAGSRAWVNARAKARAWSWVGSMARAWYSSKAGKR